MINILLMAHRWDAYISIAWMLLAAVYGLASHRRQPTNVPPRYKAILITGGSLLLLQVLLGLALLAWGLNPASSLHIFAYGALSPLVLPWAYMYTRQEGKRHPNLVFGVVSLFLFAFLIRGTFTG
ncbi:MAG: hypothetical protein Q7K03_01405 [Dehalococcoidia bacterium]|nr:hypothetical protein [Dehalococcoidia bacterium]